MNHQVTTYPFTNTATTPITIPAASTIHGVRDQDATHGTLVATVNPDPTKPTKVVTVYQYAVAANIPASVYPHLKYLGVVSYAGTFMAVFLHD